jgi:hypothetical protein
MAIFHLPLMLSKQINFYKLMGCGRNGTFDKTPDLIQWCILFTSSTMHTKPLDAVPKFVTIWFKIFTKQYATVTLSTLTAHGKWDDENPFGNPKQNYTTGTLAVLTRANINWNRLKHFWSHVEAVAQTLKQTEGFITSVGIGEIPWKKQATISFWTNEESMKQFAYKQREHAEVVQKTKQQKWYQEDLFCRFVVVGASGSLQQFDFTSLLSSK